MTGIPFPREQELCTRYATQITHRREAEPSINITIIPGPHESDESRKYLEAFHKQVGTVAQLHAELPDILDEVNERMGVRTNKNPNGAKTFSEDVLKIERCGPEEDYLTVIDVPGIFRLKTDGVTTDKDKELVKEMVHNYIRDSRTIILAVLPCNVDIATQEILAIAEEYDKTGDRTLGILTKPDLVKERSAQAVVCGLVEGKRRPLNLGYFLVKNRGGDDNEENPPIHEREKFFEREPWCQLSEERVGIYALRTRLQELLGLIMDQAFPKLRAEAREMLVLSQKALKSLGPTRETEREQQQYLAAIAGDFQQIGRSSLAADYSSLECFTNLHLRLITNIVTATETFNDGFSNHSHAYMFETSPESDPVAPDEGEDVDQSEDDLEALSLGEFLQRRQAAFIDLDGIITDDLTKPKPKKGITNWICSIYQRSRGIELGTFGPAMLSTAFREQSVHWELLTTQYLSTIIVIIHHFIVANMETVCPDGRARKELMASMMNQLLASYQAGMEQAKFLVHVERQKRPYTLNHYFNNNLQKSRGNRITEHLRGFARKEGWKDHGKLVIELDRIDSVTRNRSNAEHVLEDIHDILEAYYKVARKRFVDNVYHQAVDHYLLSGPNSPLLFFTEKWVLELDADTLAIIAGESLQSRAERARLRKRIEDLQGAIEIMR